MQQRTRLVIGNWKMNGSLQSNAVLLRALEARAQERRPGCEVALCVPFVFLPQVKEAVRGTTIALGAQDVSEFENGAYTGETSAAMLLEFGCRYVLVGHSERRTWFGDTDERVARKAAAVIAAGLVPVVCVGETLEEREQGRAESVVKRQLDAVIGAIGTAGLENVVVAYEPVWAIGTGKTATPDEAQAMHAMIRKYLSGQLNPSQATPNILYGGSVKAANAASLFGCDDIDGGLIGGASLLADDFLAIVDAAVDASGTRGVIRVAA